jgi:site-specific DNA-methyltransferase (adenine-specific)
MVDLIYLPACVNHSLDSGDHPSPKPLALYRWLIERVAGHTILDPFMGSGTSLRAAKDLGRKAIGIEIEERYCEIAARRMAQLVLL